MKSARKYEILKCICEEFIKTGVPVGSKALLESYPLHCSSATVRNARAELEEEGYLEKKHVSSGRRPSSKGYQFYLEHLNSSNQESSIGLDFQREFQTILKDRSKSVEDVLTKSCERISERTKRATVVLGPKADQESLVSIQLLSLSEKSARFIFITDSGYVEKKTFVRPSNENFTARKNAVDFLSKRLRMTKISELEEKTKALQPLAVKRFGQEGKRVIQAFLEALISFARKKLTVYGQKNLLSLPEFQNDRQAYANAIDTLQDGSSRSHSLTESDELGDANVGFTHVQKGDRAIVSKAVGKDQIAVVGPKRRDYKKILATLDYVAYRLDHYFFSSDQSSTSLIPITPAMEIKKPARKKKSTKKGVKNESGNKQ